MPASTVAPPPGTPAAGRRPAGTPARLLVRLLVTAAVVGVFWLPPALASGTPWGATAGSVLAAVVAVAMLLRERLSAAAVAGVGLVTLVAAALGLTEDVMLATAWCQYPLAVRHGARARHLVVVLAVLLLAAASVVGFPDDRAQVARWAVASLAVTGTTWLLGTAVGRQLAAAREAAAATARLEVAREVHDVVGHALGLVSAQAAVARTLPDADEAELRASLAEIEGHARRALQEVQGLVRTLRTTGADVFDVVAAAPDDLPDTQLPRPDVRPLATRLDELVARTRAAGVPVEVHLDVTDVAPATAAVAYRLVQEALANVARHAPGATCTLVVAGADDRLHVSVRDDGPGASGAPGFGLTGMRERAQLVGGTVTWGDHPDGGFEVVADLPTSTSGGPARR